MKQKKLLLVLAAVLMFVTGCGNNQDAERGETTRNFCSSSRAGFAGQYTLSDNGFMWLSLEEMLCYLDFSSGETIYLCNKEGCSHTGSDCNASVAGVGGTAAFFYNGNLYIVSSDFNQFTLLKANADGTNRKEILKDMPGGVLTHMLLIDGKLYYAATISVEPDEGEHVMAMKQYSVVVECDLKKETSKVIASYEDEVGTLVETMCTDGKNIYYLTSTPSESISDILYEADEEDEEFTERLGTVQKSCRLYCYTLKNGENSLVLDETMPYLDTYGLWGADDEKGCLLLTQQKGFFWLKDGEEEAVSITMENFQMTLLEDKLVFYDNINQQLEVYDIDTGEKILSCPLGDDDASVQLLGGVGTRLCFFNYGTGIKMDFYDIDLNELIAGNVSTLHSYN